MLKQLLTGIVLLAFGTAFSQTTGLRKSTSILNMSEKTSTRIKLGFLEEGNGVSNLIGPSLPARKPQTTWKAISNSMNVYGVVVSNSKPLQFNDELCAVSFVHRKPETYISSPVLTPSTAASGVIISMITTNWGDDWDSTAIWNNSQQWGRYPQGGLYSPPTNTDISNAYVVVSGPITQANQAIGWIGNYIASKKLDVTHGLLYDNVASSATDAQQFFPNSAPVNSVTGKFDFARYGFSSTDDGKVRSLGFLCTDVNNGSTFTAYTGFSGAVLLTGTYNGSGAFTWTSTVISPTVEFSSVSNTSLITEIPHMAWSEDGQTGFVWFVGCRPGAVVQNSGFQPIVFKTTDAGQNWNLLPGIDFTQPEFNAPVLSKLNPVGGSTMNPQPVIPFFTSAEGTDGTVDKFGRLHIATTLLSSSTSLKDSLMFIQTYSMSSDNTSGYNFEHTPGRRAYLYDFTETATGWTVAIIDSISSEGPGVSPGTSGYVDNPWDPTGGNPGQNIKVGCDSRIQMSRTCDGSYIIYTWAESDSSLFQNKKWNVFPNVKAKMRNVTTGQVHPVEINVTGGDVLTDGRAFNHFVSPKCATVTSTNQTGIGFALPVTVTFNENIPLTQQTTNTHYYNTAILNFDNVPNMLKIQCGTTVGIKENELGQSSNIYPNPARSIANLDIRLSDNSKVRVEIYNVAGQLVKNPVYDGTGGENTFSINLDGLTKGMYMAKIHVGTASSTKKLIVE